MECPICLATIDKSFIILNCHCKNTSFHNNCINIWFKISNTCPICKFKFKTKNKSDNYHDNLKRALLFDSINRFNRFYYVT